MYRSYQPPPLTWATTWFGISLATFLGQMMTGTDILFATASLAIFIFIPVVYRLYYHLDNIGGLILLATFGKLFLVSQWLKILFFQAADTNLDSPHQTVLLLLLALICFWLAGLLMWPFLAHRGGLLQSPQDPNFLLILSAVTLTVTLLALIACHYLGLSKLGDGEYEKGRGLVALLYATQLSPLAVAALTARAAILSNGRRFLDGFVIIALTFTVLQGVWENLRTSMMAGGVAFACTYLAYGGRIRGTHVTLVIVMGIVMQMFIFPLIDIQRGFSSDLTAMEFLERTAIVATDMLDPKARADHEYVLEEIYLSWYTRLYYGEPQGFLDRFAPNAVDETITLFQGQNHYGMSYLISQTSHLIPNIVLNPLGFEHPVNSGKRLELDVFGRHTFMNYGMIAELYASAGYLLFVPAAVFMMAFYFTGLHVLYGPMRNNYLSSYAFSTCYFTFASGDMKDALPQLSAQGVLNVLFFLLILALTGRLPMIIGKRTKHSI